MDRKRESELAVRDWSEVSGKIQPGRSSLPRTTHSNLPITVVYHGLSIHYFIHGMYAYIHTVRRGIDVHSMRHTLHIEVCVLRTNEHTYIHTNIHSMW